VSVTYNSRAFLNKDRGSAIIACNISWWNKPKGLLETVVSISDCLNTIRIHPTKRPDGTLRIDDYIDKLETVVTELTEYINFIKCNKKKINKIYRKVGTNE